MSSFENREHGFENKFAHDEALRFKSMARRNKLLGLWAAELMGLAGEAAANYARAVVAEDLVEAGDEDVFRKVAADVGAHADANTVRSKMIELLAVAVAQVQAEG